VRIFLVRKYRGNPWGLLEANVAFALKNPEMKAKLTEMICRKED
jgi:hypothetical protein